MLQPAREALFHASLSRGGADTGRIAALNDFIH